MPSGDTFGDQKQKVMANPPEKSPYTKVFNKFVDKFKIKAPESDKKAFGNGHLSIEYAEVNGKKVYILVFRNSIGKTLY
jgi:hypothetical protein